MLSVPTLLLAFNCLVGAASIVPGGKAFDRFITIWLENQDYDKVVADPHFLDLKREGISLTRYYAHTHPSQPNYLAAVGGDYFGLNHDEFVRIPQNVSTVADLLEFKEIPWAGYFEDMPGPGYMAMGSDGSTGNGGWDYVRKHNPFVSYDSINMNGWHLLNLRSFASFQRDVVASAVPQFVFMSPNMMHDGHNTTLGASTSWSHHFIEPLLSAFPADERTLILLTFDESEDYSRPNHIASLLLGSAVPAALKGTTDDGFYTHYSILSTVEYNWGLPNLGRYDVGANVFGVVADTTGYKGNKDPGNVLTVNNSVSYPGALHNETDKWAAIPPPNLKLVGAGGLPVLDSIKVTWASTADALSPYDGSGDVYDGDKNLPVYKAQAANSA
ncbi:Acid phosphatase-like protein [Pleurostoma richardsiae]|uniref:Acid phosphatase-like protein n=1 Tax=Pleurostoma richardsiae TaxID=41990 RepID=A0AA38RQX2_9PEZI|nr:Acid phosphatase-like protein [Pleurostoma richardsiae]